MNYYQIETYDKYQVLSHIRLNNYDIEILIRLYQPLISFGGMSLFLTLWSELENFSDNLLYSRTHQHLLNIMQCNINQLVNFRRSLEAVGLVKTYTVYENDVISYVYELFSPKQPQSLYKNSAFSEMLQSRLGVEYYELTKKYFDQAISLPKSAANISASFDEVFEIANSVSTSETDKFNDQKTLASDSNFDFETFLIGFKEYFIPKNSFTPNVRSTICRLAQMNNIDILTMRDLVNSSVKVIRGKKTIDLETLTYRVANYRFELFKSRGLKDINMHKTESSDIAKEELSTYESKIEVMDTTSPSVYYSYIFGRPPITRYIKCMQDLSVLGLNNGAINVIFDYIKLQNNGDFTISYVQKIGDYLAKNEAFDASKAIEAIKDYVYEAKPLKNYKQKPSSISKANKISSSKVNDTVDDEPTSNESLDVNDILSDFKKIKFGVRK